MIEGGYKRTKEHNRKISISCKGKVLSDETKAKISIGRKGKKPMLGKRHSEETKKKMSRDRMGNKYSLGYKHSMESRVKMSKSHKGEKSYLWKGGITPFAKKIRHTLEYRQWRSDVFTRDSFACQECNEKGVYLEAHHIKSFAQIIKENKIKTIEQAISCQELWNINNGITYCKDCHKKNDKKRH